MTAAVILSPTDASFRQVAGLPLIQRTAAALRVGFEPVVAVDGRDRLPVFLADKRTKKLRSSDPTSCRNSHSARS
jgi:hypothetical protein